jgi:hypothetical protein
VRLYDDGCLCGWFGMRSIGPWVITVGIPLGWSMALSCWLALRMGVAGWWACPLLDDFFLGLFGRSLRSHVSLTAFLIISYEDWSGVYSYDAMPRCMPTII